METYLFFEGTEFPVFMRAVVWFLLGRWKRFRFFAEYASQRQRTIVELFLEEEEWGFGIWNLGTRLEKQTDFHGRNVRRMVSDIQPTSSI